MSAISSQSKIVKELMAAGIIPANCTHWELICDPIKPVRIRSEVFVTEEEFRVVADALLFESRGALGRETFVRSIQRERTSEAIGPVEQIKGTPPVQLYAEKP